MTSEPPPVHGLTGELVEPDWPPLEGDEVTAVLAHYGIGPAVELLWTSPRPMSAAALVSVGGRQLFVKRRDRRVRGRDDLEVEHAFAAHLAAGAVAVPAVLETAEGSTVVERGSWVYEVHDRMAGTDLYRDAMSWTPYRSAADATAAGAALARLHRAAEGFDLPARPPGVLVDSCVVLTASSPMDEMAGWIEGRPGLASFLDGRPWESEVATALAPWMPAASDAAGREPALWTHGDWHPSNLSWRVEDGGSEVAGVFDLGLANRTFALHDLAVAVERAGIDWLAADPEEMAVDWGGVRGLLEGYRSARAASLQSLVEMGSGLAAILPVVHVEYALSEIEYFWSVVGSRANSELAYEGYLLGHCRWFGTDRGGELLDWLRSGA